MDEEEEEKEEEEEGIISDWTVPYPPLPCPALNCIVLPHLKVGRMKLSSQP